MRRLVPLVLTLCVLVAGCKIGGGSSDSEDSGKLDTSFNDPYGFSVYAEGSGGSVGYSRPALQADGRILVTGNAMPASDIPRLLVARYTADGRLDASFGQDGLVTYTTGPDGASYGRAIAVQDDGRIVVSGYTISAQSIVVLVVRLNADGTLDTDFGTNGVTLVSVLDGNPALSAGMALAIQPDGAIVVAGTAMSPEIMGQGFVLRLSTDGSLDTGFGTNGIFRVDTGAWVSLLYGLTLPGDGSIIAAGALSETDESQIEPLLVKLTPQGRLDTDFGAGGLALWSAPGGEDAQLIDVAADSDGSLVGVGTYRADEETTDMLVLKFTADGETDGSFADDGAFVYDADTFDMLQAATVLPDGHILAAGYVSGVEDEKLTLLKLTPDGAPAAGFGDKGVFTFQQKATSVSEGTGMVLQPGRGILVCGTTRPDISSRDQGLILRVNE